MLDVKKLSQLVSQLVMLVMLDVKMLDVRKMLRCQMFDVRCQMLDVRCQMLDVRCLRLELPFELTVRTSF